MGMPHRGGYSWRPDIQEHLDAAKCVIVAWSKRSVGPAGEFVRDEATRARRRGTYLPIRIDAVEPPLGFGEVQALPFTRWKGDRSDPRFRALVDAARSRIAGERARPHVLADDDHPRVSRRAVMAGGAAAVVAAGAGGWLLRKPTAANAKRIAVLPFANLSSDKEQAYFSEGIAEELRAALSRSPPGGSSSLFQDVKDFKPRRRASLTSLTRPARSPLAFLIRMNAQLSASQRSLRWSRARRAPGERSDPD